MESEKKCVKLSYIWDRYTFLVALAMTLLHFFSVAMADDASFLTIPALGRTAPLGFLYDERTDKFRPFSVFSKAIPSEVVLETQNTDVTTHIQETNTYKEKLELLEIDLNAAANILVENTKVRGTARILNDCNLNSLVQQQTLLRTHHTVDENLQVYYNDLEPLFNKHLLNHQQATHIVSSISWGSRISVSLQTTTTATPTVDAQVLSDAFHDEFQKIKGNPSTSTKIIENLNFTIDIKSDIPLTGPLPTTTSDVAILLNKMPQLINGTKGGKGVPLEFTLTPLSELRKHLNVPLKIFNPLWKIPESSLRSLSIIFDDMASSEQQINAVYQKTYLQLNCLPPQSREEIADMRTNFLNYKKQVADNLKKTLVDARSNSESSLALKDFAEEFNQSNFSSRNIKNKIRKFDDVIGKLALCQMLEASYGDIEYFNSNQNLILRISESDERPFYILFTKTEFKRNNPVKYTEDLNFLLKTLYLPSNKLIIVDCDGGHVFCSSLNQTEIHEYKNGKLVSLTDLKNSDGEENRNLMMRILELEKKTKIIYNLTEQLRHDLQNRIKDKPTHYPKSVKTCHYPGTCAPPSDAGQCQRCRDGFIKDPEDNTTCKYANESASLFITSEDDDIKIISLDGLHTTQVLQSEFGFVRGIDYCFRTNTIFWSSWSDRKIYTASIHAEAAKKSIFDFDGSSGNLIEGFAVDWIYQHLYWVRPQVVVSNFNGTMRKVLFRDEILHPQWIALDPLSGWMYWTDVDTYRIERAGLDGSRREVILSTNIKFLSGLAVDLEDSRLYWSQGTRPSSIWSCEFDGSDRKLIFTADQSTNFPSGFSKIAMYDKYVYFLEYASKTIYKVNKCNGEELEMIYKSKSLLQDIKIYDVTLQPENENLCLKRIDHCSHFCFPVPSPGNSSVPTTTCACPDGLSLSADQQNCA